MTVNENITFTGYVYGIMLPDCYKLAINQKMTMISHLSNMRSLSIFFNLVFFLLSSLVIGPSFLSITSLVLELRQFTFIRY